MRFRCFTRSCARSVLIVAGMLYAAPAFAQDVPEKAARLANDIHETIARVPVTVTLPDGKQHAGRIIVTHYRPDGSGPFPIVVLNHGRENVRHKRAVPARRRYTDVARYFVHRGFAVLVPTRLGYGDAGLSPDPEFSGSKCNERNFDIGVAALIEQTRAVVDFAGTLPFADTRRIILVGQSYGGLGTIAATGKNLPGVIAAINFSGGAGGLPKTDPGRPCSPEEFTAVAKDAGSRARIPTLWLYSENDHYWGTEWPPRWYEAYTSGGGRAEMPPVPAVGKEGHTLLARGFQIWRPLVDRFLDNAGFPPTAARQRNPSAAAPPRSR